MPDPNTEHGLRVQLATALRERDEMALRAEHFAARILAAESERDALRADVMRLREALGAAHDHAHAAGCRGYLGDNFFARIRAALCTGGDRG